MCLGQISVRMGTGRGRERKGEKMHEQNGSGYKRLRHLCLDERETPGRARTDNLGTRESRHRQRKELRKVGPLDKTIWTSMGGTTVQCAETGRSSKDGSTGAFRKSSLTP